jgi:endonuclease YncB( thermonuclease family)
MRVFFQCLLPASCLLVASFAVAESCAPDRIDEFAKIARIFDGDTIQLEDGRRVRLIGINAAETGKDGQPSEPYADEAREALLSLLKPQSTVAMRFDEERHDQYRRLLAHLYTPETLSVEAWLLENGYAQLIAIPPNLWNLACYRQAEQRAQTQRKGMWSQSYYQAIDAAAFGNNIHGFRSISGRVNHVGETAKSFWLDLYGGVALRIDRDDIQYFDGIKFTELKNHKVIARGWVHGDANRPVMRIRHPVSLQVLD